MTPSTLTTNGNGAGADHEVALKSLREAEHAEIEELREEIRAEHAEIEELRHTVKPPGRDGTVVLASFFALILAMAAVLAVAFKINDTEGGSAAVATPAAPLPVKDVAMAIKPDSKLGPDGSRHDAFLPSTDIKVQAGQTVHLTITNYDDMPHSFTSPGLAAGAAIPPDAAQIQGTPQDLTTMPMAGIGVDQRIPPAMPGKGVGGSMSGKGMMSGGSTSGMHGGGPSKTTVTFTAPSQAGTYIWYCKLPCDPFAMAHNGYMRGRIIVTAA